MRFTSPITMRPKTLEDVGRMLRNLDDRVREIVSVPILRGRLVEVANVTSAGRTFRHGLGRQAKGGICVLQGSTTPRTISFREPTKTTLTVDAAAGDQTIWVWVF